MPLLFEDIFEIKDIDPQGKKFQKVSRLVCTGDHYEMEMTLDVHSELFPADINDKFNLAIASSADDGQAEEALFESYDYVMYGKVFKYLEDSARSVSVMVSFGGLLMALKADPRNLALELGSRVFLLMRKLV